MNSMEKLKIVTAAVIGIIVIVILWALTLFVVQPIFFPGEPQPGPEVKQKIVIVASFEKAFIKENKLWIAVNSNTGFAAEVNCKNSEGHKAKKSLIIAKGTNDYELFGCEPTPEMWFSLESEKKNLPEEKLLVELPKLLPEADENAATTTTLKYNYNNTARNERTELFLKKAGEEKWNGTIAIISEPAIGATAGNEPTLYWLSDFSMDLTENTITIEVSKEVLVEKPIETDANAGLSIDQNTVQTETVAETITEEETYQLNEFEFAPFYFLKLSNKFGKSAEQLTEDQNNLFEDKKLVFVGEKFSNNFTVYEFKLQEMESTAVIMVVPSEPWLLAYSWHETGQIVSLPSIELSTVEAMEFNEEDYAEFELQGGVAELLIPEIP